MVKAEENTDKEKMLYSETRGNSEIDEEKIILTKTVQNLEKENQLIHENLSRLEQETSMLRDLFSNANNELNNLKLPALLVSEVVSVHDDKSVIRLPNGNKFY